MKKLLITGFDPFGGENINPAWEAVKRLPDTVGDWKLTKLEIPTVYGVAAEKVLVQANDLQPDVILCIGQAGGRKAITPEMVGINLRHARIADNAGNQPQDEPVAANGPAAYFATVPVRRMTQAIEDAGLPAAVSYSAGTFVCNDTLYALLHHYAGTPVRAGFVHVPFLPEQAKEGVPSMALEDIVRGLTIMIESME
ncbi:MAG: pyroglutamyl-peptidase I [Clostridia bacterium]|nr:pyroglutamyl-peptidase I [Clostridia bacterium]